MRFEVSVQDERGRQLLDVIDNLRTLTSISRDIDLPRIVVVGQHASGKSSVLRALSNIPFPSNDGLCTQFATEIICRRTSETSMRAEIIPASGTVEEQSRKIEEFSAIMNKLGTEKDLDMIIDNARQIMGINEMQIYSEDILRLEFCGPTQDHMTIIDLPGLVSTPQKNVEQVDRLVSRYLEKPNTIILAVVNGPLHQSSQRVFDKYAPHHQRTIGVITAPDLVDWKATNASDICDLVRNIRRPAALGWHILRNLSSGELRDIQGSELSEREVRAKVEKDCLAKLVKEPIWTNMTHVALGIEELKKKVGKLLRTLIVKQLPDIHAKIKEGRASCEKELKVLGMERSTSKDQRIYLETTSERLMDAITQDLSGTPNMQAMEQEAKDLRNIVRNANLKFAGDFDRTGHTWEFVLNGEPGSESPAEAITEDYLRPLRVSWPALTKYMADKVYNNPGRTLPGTFDPVWIGQFFLQQSRRWEILFNEHVENIFYIVQTRIEGLVRSQSELEVSERLLDQVVRPQLELRRTRLIAKMNELMIPYQSRYPLTLKRQYATYVKEVDTMHTFTNGQHDVSYSGADRVGEQIYRCVSQYYIIAKDILLDNMESLAIENVLLKDLQKILTPKLVAEMSEEQLQNLVGESDLIIERRQSLQQRISDFEKGRKLLSQHSHYSGTSQALMSLPPSENAQSKVGVDALNQSFNNLGTGSEPNLSGIETNVQLSTTPVTPKKNDTADTKLGINYASDVDSGIDTNTPSRKIKKGRREMHNDYERSKLVADREL